MTTDHKEAAFLGRITAAFTHEMKNVLAIIKESAGLMEDLLVLYAEPAVPHKDRFLRCLTTIQTQTQRGVELAGRLNRFAHSPDEEVASLDLNDILEQVVALSGRFARLKGISLQVEPRAEAVTVVVSPVRLQMMLFTCLECCWEGMAAGGRISLSIALQDQEATVQFCCQDGGDGTGGQPARLSADEAQRLIQEMATSLPCRLAWGDSGGGLELIFPVVG